MGLTYAAKEIRSRIMPRIGLCRVLALDVGRRTWGNQRKVHTRQHVRLLASPGQHPRSAEGQIGAAVYDDNGMLQLTELFVKNY